MIESLHQRLYIYSYPKTCQQVFTSLADLKFGNTSKTCRMAPNNIAAKYRYFAAAPLGDLQSARRWLVVRLLATVLCFATKGISSMPSLND